jgi:hypothetical protein
MDPSLFPSSILAPLPRKVFPNSCVGEALWAAEDPASPAYSLDDYYSSTLPGSDWVKAEFPSDGFCGNVRWGAPMRPHLMEWHVWRVFSHLHCEFSKFALHCVPSPRVSEDCIRSPSSRLTRAAPNIQPKGLVTVPFAGCVCFWFGDLPFVSSV